MEEHFNKEYISRLEGMSKDERKEELRKINDYTYFDIKFGGVEEMDSILARMDSGEDVSVEEIEAVEHEDFDDYEARCDKMYEGSMDVLRHFKEEVMELNKLPYTEDDIMAYSNLPLEERLQTLLNFIDTTEPLEFYDQEDLNKMDLIKELYKPELTEMCKVINDEDVDGDDVVKETCKVMLP
jgi:hypothetical protein